MFATLLDRIELTAAIVTADAMYAQRDHAEYRARRGAHYLLTVKRNQPSLHNQLAASPRRAVPVADAVRDRGHGQAERRTLKVTAVAAGLLFPHAAQTLQIVRRRRPLHHGKRWSTETVYAITSLNAPRPTPPTWPTSSAGTGTIEDRLHWIRDVTHDEDRCQIRTGNGPRVMASLRNLAITILRLTGDTNIAEALCRHAGRPDRPLKTIMNC